MNAIDLLMKYSTIYLIDSWFGNKATKIRVNQYFIDFKIADLMKRIWCINHSPRKEILNMIIYSYCMKNSIILKVLLKYRITNH